MGNKEQTVTGIDISSDKALDENSDIKEKERIPLNKESAQKADKFIPYAVRVETNALNIRKGAGTNYPVAGCIYDRGVYTIIENASGQGSDKGWGKLQSGAGWIALDWVTPLES